MYGSLRFSICTGYADQLKQTNQMDVVVGTGCVVSQPCCACFAGKEFWLYGP
jgi:hypothetical protein